MRWTALLVLLACATVPPSPSPVTPVTTPYLPAPPVSPVPYGPPEPPRLFRTHPSKKVIFYDPDLSGYFMEECLKTEGSSLGFCSCVLVQLYDLRIEPRTLRYMIRSQHGTPATDKAVEQCGGKR